MSDSDHAGETEKVLSAMKLGAPDVFINGLTLTVEGTTYNATNFLSTVAGFLAYYQAVSSTKLAWEQALASRRAQESSAEQFVASVKLAAGGAFGTGSEAYQLLGFAPKKKAPPLTPEEKQTKLERMRATRVARNTMGKRQKRAVKGVVPPAQGSTGSPAQPSPPAAPGQGNGGNTAKP
jgi:hypothetical protein